MESFIRLSKYAGMREDLVQASGGNSSYKIAPERMMIKASGFQLADITEQSGYATVDPQVIRDAFLNCGDIDRLTERDAKELMEKAYISGARPSIETFLHAVSDRYSLHTHPIVVNALACRADGEEILRELFPDALIVPYATPGIELAKMYFKKYIRHMELGGAEPKFVFLMNHGFITSAATAEEVIRQTEEATRRIESYLNVDLSGYRRVNELQSFYDDGIVWRVTDSNVLKMLERSGGAWRSNFCPDCVVFLGKQIMAADSGLDKKAFESFAKVNGLPTVVVIGGDAYIHAASVKKALETQSVLSFSAQVAGLNRDHECKMLSDDEMNYLLGWDAETYRKDMK